jgi:molybdate transport system ATP-binding protein
MADEIIADFEKQHPGGPLIHGRLRLPLDRPHVTVLFGPSGSGKTTILRCLAGLDHPDRGTIAFGTERWFGESPLVRVPPQARRVGMLFQHYALFPHLTVLGNLSYGLSHLARAERESRCRELIGWLKLEGLEDRKPGELSGGQQQRVALGRVLAIRPRVLLLDEPLSALDKATRDQVRGELRGLLRQLAIPTICVTHDWEETLSLADEVAVINQGRILQTGLPDEVFSRPADAEVAAIVGVDTVVAGTVSGRVDGLLAMDVSGVRLWAIEPVTRGAAPPMRVGDPIYLSIRAEDVTLEIFAREQTSARNHLTGQVETLTPTGALVRVRVHCGFTLTALVTRQAINDLSLTPGQSVIATIKASAVHVIPR